MIKKRSLIFSLFALTLIFSFSAVAQTSVTLSGRIADEQQAPVAGASVRIVNVATNVTQSATTNSNGFYVFSELRPGTYRLTVQNSGFQTTIKENIVLNVGSQAREDVTLKVGEVSVEITVEDQPAVVERESAAVSTVVTREFVENIPLNGRSFQSLLELTPGVVMTPSQVTHPGQFSVNG